MTYQLHENGAIVRTADNAWIPADPENRDYQEYLRWQGEGGVAEVVKPPPAPAPPTPTEKLAAAGLSLDELKALLAG